MYTKRDIGAKIKERRLDIGLTQKELAAMINEGIEQTDAPHTQISSWENGSKTPRTEALVRLCNALDCDIDYLLGQISVPRKNISDVMTVTGLSYEAVKAITCEGHEGDKEIVIEALDFLLTSPNFENAMHELVSFRDAEREVACLEKARRPGGQHTQNANFHKLISDKRKDADICEYNLSKSFAFVIEELKRRTDEEV